MFFFSGRQRVIVTILNRHHLKLFIEELIETDIKDVLIVAPSSGCAMIYNDSYQSTGIKVIRLCHSQHNVSSLNNYFYTYYIYRQSNYQHFEGFNYTLFHISLCITEFYFFLLNKIWLSKIKKRRVMLHSTLCLKLNEM